MMTVTSDTSTLGRAERRARTRAAILDAARTLFGECGYQGTTIRAIARQAGVDPALVMQHFGSKEALFLCAAKVEFGIADALAGPLDTLAERLLRHLLEQLETAPDAMLSALRSMLTHEQAADAVKCAIVEDEDDPLTDILDGDDAALRSRLVGTIMIGLVVARYLLKFPELAEASTERLVERLAPCLRLLITGDGES